MAEQDPNSSISGVEPSVEPAQPSLREIAEQAYDDHSTTEGEAPSDGRVRDSQGRFAPKEQAAKTGEAEVTPPSPEKPPEAQTETDPAAAARSNQPPDHWSAEDRAVFAKLPPDAQSMLQRRYSEMEADYTRKSQANASAVQAVNAIAPIFNDPVIQQSLEEWKSQPVEMIHQWAGMHKRALGTVAERAGLMIEMAERMGFDPARLFATQGQPQAPQMPPGADKDPAVRYFADQFGRTASDLQALRAEVQNIRADEARKYEEESLKNSRRGIDSWADEKGPDGKVLRPDFDEQLPYILELFKANPDRDLGEAYETARRMNPKTWGSIVEQERARVQSQQAVSKAQAANRGNLRGLTSPVSKPTEKQGNGSLRDTLEASADEVGF